MNPEEFGHLRQGVAQTKTESENAREFERASNMGEESQSMGWDYYDSSLQNYEASFEDVFPEGVKSFQEYIDRYYANKKGDLVGIEIGGPAIKLFNGLNEDGVFRKTAGFTLHTPKEAEVRLPHQIIEADVFNKRNPNDKLPGYQTLEKWIKENGKADMLIERMVGGIGKDDNVLLSALRRWYTLLNEEGSAFIELPTRFSSQEFIDQFLSKHTGEFDYSIQKRDRDRDYIGGSIAGVFLRLRKLPGAPETLDELIK